MKSTFHQARIRFTMIWVLTVLVFGSLVMAQEVKKAVERAEVPEPYRWRMEDIYASDQEWENDFTRVEPLLAQFDALPGTLGSSPQQLLTCLKLEEEATRLIVKLAFYASRKADEDRRVSHYQSLQDRLTGIYSRFGQKKAFIEPEIMQIPEDRLWNFVNNTPELKIYRHYFENLLRTKPHVLSEPEERLLAMAGEVTQAPTYIFGMFDNADLKFPEIIDENGNKVELTKGRYQLFMRSSNRAFRQRAWEAYYQTYENWKNTLAASLNSEVKTNIFYSRARKYNSALEAALDSDNLPTAVYENLVTTVNNYLEPLHHYISFRKKVLGIEKVHLYDLYAPLLADVKWEIPYDEATTTVEKALEPLGKDYTQIVKKAVSDRWIDVYENAGKVSGAYSSFAYGLTHPYILMNYQNQARDMYTLAHELGHSLHSYYTNQTQPFVYGGYSYFLAEVASTFNEALLTDYLLKKVKEKEKKLYLLNQYLENILTTVYTQVMYAEFEQAIHARAEAGQPLNAEVMNEIFVELQKKYYGADFELDPMGASRWNRIPHFYRNFYVFKYATGFAASTALSQKVLSGDKKARDAYLQFISSGRSDYDLNLLKKAGVDMTSPQPIEATLQLFDKLLKEIETMI